jgi:hypothetical protein
MAGTDLLGQRPAERHGRAPCHRAGDAGLPPGRVALHRSLLAAASCRVLAAGPASSSACGSGLRVCGTGIVCGAYWSRGARSARAAPLKRASTTSYSIARASQPTSSGRRVVLRHAFAPWVLALGCSELGRSGCRAILYRACLLTVARGARARTHGSPAPQMRVPGCRPCRPRNRHDVPRRCPPHRPSPPRASSTVAMQALNMRPQAGAFRCARCVPARGASAASAANAFAA